MEVHDEFAVVQSVVELDNELGQQAVRIVQQAFGTERSLVEQVAVGKSVGSHHTLS